MHQTPTNLDNLQIKMIYTGIFINILFPLILVSIGLIIQNKIEPINQAFLSVFLYSFLGISASEIVALIIFKKKLLSTIRPVNPGLPGPSFDSVIYRTWVVIFVLAAGPALYGFIYFLLGGSIEWFVFFLAVNLILFQVFKPRAVELKRLQTKFLNS